MPTQADIDKALKQLKKELGPLGIEISIMGSSPAPKPVKTPRPRRDPKTGLIPTPVTMKLEYRVLSVACPWCENPAIENPITGSVDWHDEDIDRYISQNGKVVHCDYCGNPVRLVVPPRR